MSKYPLQIIPRVPYYAHQREALELSWDRPFFALLMEMGTGKTKIVIDSIAGLHVTDQINGVLLIAPKGCYLNWIVNEIPTHMPDQVDYFVGTWSAQMKKEQEKKVLQVTSKPTPGILDILAINIEALNSVRGMTAAFNFLGTHKTMTVVDESTVIKSPKAERTKRALAIGRLSAFRRIMTGTPIPQSPLDFFTQFQFLSPGVLGFTSFTAFRAYYAEMVTMVLGPRHFPKIVGYRNVAQLEQTVSKHAYRKLKTECLDLPPKVYEMRYVEMTPEQRKVYETLRNQALVELSSSKTSVTSALTLILKLQQIACGFLVDDAGIVHQLPCAKVEALLEILEETVGKVLIWCCFHNDVEFIHSQLVEKYGSESVVTYYGKTTTEEREMALDRFHNDSNTRFFIGTPATGGRSLTLVEASTAIFYSCSYNLEHRLQSEDRIHRIGQRNTATIIDIVCQETVDTKIVASLRAKKNLAETILSNVRTILSEEDDITV